MVKICYLFFLIVILFDVKICTGFPDCDESCQIYDKQREILVDKENSFHFDARVVLNDNEMKVDALLDYLRNSEYVKNSDADRYILASNFRDVKDQIEMSKVFSILKKMPKGGILHTHGFGDARTLVKLGTYDPDCWINIGNETNVIQTNSFLYSPVKPPEQDGVKWARVVDLRANAIDTKIFDETLFNYTQFFTPSSMVSENTMWADFNKCIKIVASLASKESVFRAWVLEGLHILVDDGVMHLDLRGFMNFPLIPGTVTYKYNNTEIILLWLELLKDFNSQMPPEKQISIRFIYSVGRTILIPPMYQDLLTAVTLQNTPVVGEYVVGFDIVDEEDRYNSLYYYLSDWMGIKEYIQSNNLTQIKYFFHAGETTWNRMKTENLFDAVLLNTTRIGHGFALHSYPLLMQEVKEKDIAVEVSPISNQMLRLLDDMRDHPALTFLNNGLAISISSDDSIVYGNHGLTYDFWAAFMSWNLTLSGLKKLTINSIQYSALPPLLKVEKLIQLDTAWNEWILYLINFMLN